MFLPRFRPPPPPARPMFKPRFRPPLNFQPICELRSRNGPVVGECGLYGAVRGHRITRPQSAAMEKHFVAGKDPRCTPELPFSKKARLIDLLHKAFEVCAEHLYDPRVIPIAHAPSPVIQSRKPNSQLTFLPLLHSADCCIHRDSSASHGREASQGEMIS